MTTGKLLIAGSAMTAAEWARYARIEARLGPMTSVDIDAVRARLVSTFNLLDIMLLRRPGYLRIPGHGGRH